MKRWVIAMVLCGLCHTGAFAYGYNQQAQSKDWGYQPVYKSVSAPSYCAAASAPTYQFRTTSVYIGAPGASYSPMRRSSSFPWGDDYEPGGNALGEVDDDFDEPVGDAPWCLILLLAAGYIFYSIRWGSYQHRGRRCGQKR